MKTINRLTVHEVLQGEIIKITEIRNITAVNYAQNGDEGSKIAFDRFNYGIDLLRECGTKINSIKLENEN